MKRTFLQRLLFGDNPPCSMDSLPEREPEHETKTFIPPPTPPPPYAVGDRVISIVFEHGIGPGDELTVTKVEETKYTYSPSTFQVHATNGTDETWSYLNEEGRSIMCFRKPEDLTEEEKAVIACVQNFHPSFRIYEAPTGQHRIFWKANDHPRYTEWNELGYHPDVKEKPPIYYAHRGAAGAMVERASKLGLGDLMRFRPEADDTDPVFGKLVLSVTY